MSDERRAEIEAVARALYEQGFGFNIDADPVARESMFSVARVVLDRVRDARGDDECRQGRQEWAVSGDPAMTCVRCGVPWARSSQGEDHEAGIEAVARIIAETWHHREATVDDWDRQQARKAIAAYLARVSAPKADEKQEASQNDERRH